MSTRKPVALLLNDIHVSKDNIPEFYKNWNEAIGICKSHEIKDMIIGGDLWQSRAAQTLDVLMAVRQAIMMATNNGVTLTIAEGNHCKVDQEAVEGYSHIFSEYPEVFIVDDYTVIEFSEKVMLYIMSYFPENGSFTQRLADIVENDFDSSKHNILYIHEGINGALAVPNEKELPTKIFQGFDAVLVGHYHDRCKIKGTSIEYIGASRQHNFGEDEEKGYTLLYEDGSYEFIKNEVNTRYRVLRCHVKDVKNGELIAHLNKIADSQYKTKVVIETPSNEVKNIDKQALIEAGANKIEIVTEEMQNNATAVKTLEHKFDKQGIKKEYTDFCETKGILDVETGLKYLDKI